MKIITINVNLLRNNKSVIDTINKLNKRNKAAFISIFGFSTVYTKLSHDEIFCALHKLIDFSFNGGQTKFMTISKFGGRWSKEPSDHEICFNKHNMKDAISYLLSNCFFTIGLKNFYQIICISMGSDPAPSFASLILHYYESKWMSSLKRNELIRARKFDNFFRFINDFNVLNDGRELENNFQN